MKPHPLTFDSAIMEIFDDCAEVGELLAMKGWAEASGGNLSVRVPTEIDFSSKDVGELNAYATFPLARAYPALENQLLLLKAAGRRLRSIAKEPAKILGLAVVKDQALQLLWPKEPTFTPTSELTAHLAIQNYLARNKPTMRAVLHAHPTALIIMSFLGEHFLKTLNEKLWSVSPSMLLFLPEGLGVVNFLPPASRELAEETLPLITKHRLILWAKHGCISIGKTLSDCFDLLEIADKAAEIFMEVKHLSEAKMTQLSGEELEESRSRFNQQ